MPKEELKHYNTFSTQQTIRQSFSAFYNNINMNIYCFTTSIILPLSFQDLGYQSVSVISTFNFLDVKQVSRCYRGHPLNPPPVWYYVRIHVLDIISYCLSFLALYLPLSCQSPAASGSLENKCKSISATSMDDVVISYI